MIKFLQSLYAYIMGLFWSMELELSLVGLQNSGKSTFVETIASGEFIEETQPTIGFNMRKVQKGSVTIKVWDLGGQGRFRSMWERYCRGASAIIYMIDSSERNMDLVKQSRSELKNLLEKPVLSEIPVLVLANKNDVAGALTREDIVSMWELDQIRNRKLCIYSISCKNNTNIDKALEWLTQQGSSASRSR